MDLEQLEFLITQYLDGTLPAEDVAALEDRLAKDPEARQLLSEHQKLLGVLRGFPVPEMHWGELAKDFSAVVTGTVDEQSKSEDRKLNAFFKSALPPVPQINWDALTAQISGAIDAELDSADEQDQKLDELLHADSIPAVNWDRLAGQISQAVAREADAVEAAENAQRQRMRIFSGAWIRKNTTLAMAAMIMLVASITITIFLSHGGGSVVPGPTAVVKIEGPSHEVAAGPAVVEIQIGPSAGFARMNEGDVNVGMASRGGTGVVIAAPSRPASDDGGGLGFD